MTLDENHHHMYRKQLGGVTTVVTRMSQGAKIKDIGPALGKRMANQCYLTLAEFWRLVDCPLDETEWNRLVRERSVDGRNPFLGQ